MAKAAVIPSVESKSLASAKTEKEKTVIYDKEKMDIFTHLCTQSQADLRKLCKDKLRELKYENVYVGDGYVYAKGDYPVLLVAHLDTVHKELPQKINISKKAVVSSAQGIGGDDRCGVFIIFELIKEIKCSVLFCEDEEKGCIGARKFIDTDICKKINNINYMVEFDRKGLKDAVFYQCDNPEFTKHVESTGYFKKAHGTCSDIKKLMPAMKIAGVNLSSGYFSEHTIAESVDFNGMMSIIEEVKKLIKIEVKKPFEFIEEKYTPSIRGFNNRYNSQMNMHDYFGDYFSHLPLSKNSKIKVDKYLYLITFASPDEIDYKVAEVHANSEAEAVGKLLIKYNELCYNDIVDIKNTLQ